MGVTLLSEGKLYESLRVNGVQFIGGGVSNW